MKKILINIFLLVEAAACILHCVLRGTSSNLLYDVFSFPFKQIAWLLGKMSLSGAIGNVIAWCLYGGICLVPIIIFILKLVKRKFRAEDSLLIVLSGTLFAVLYYMINIVEFVNLMVLPIETDMSVAILGAVAYSVLLGYIIIRVVRGFRRAETSRLKSYFNTILFVVNIILVYSIFGTGFNELLIKLDNLVATNVGYESELTITKAFIIGEYAVDTVLNLMIVGIIILVQSLIENLDMDKLTDDVARKAGMISKLCMLTIIVHVIIQMAYNILQIAFIGELHVINGVVSVPMMLVVVMMLIMVLAQFILDAKRVKEENDMFV